MRLYTIPNLLHLLLPQAVWRKPGAQQQVYLTFDDGPHPEMTPWVLQQLEEYQAKGTFFMTGENATDHPDLVEQVRQAGHSIGNHTWSHCSGWKTRTTTYLEDIQQAQNVLKARLFRPPYGELMPWQARQLQRQGLQVVMWSRLAYDWQPHLNREESLRQLSGAKAGDILLFHDSEKAKEQLRWLLPRVLRSLARQNFTFGAL